jgi:crossover junction endodeoxyribonuclease RuvC
MVKLLLGLDAAPSPHDAADALAVAICHIHSSTGAVAKASNGAGASKLTSWRHYRP